MARAHRLGQKGTVMIYRLVTRGTIEERMMQISKKKMVLEHLVVGKMRAASSINQEELDDILRYGSKELFEEDDADAPGGAKSRQIHYDDAAIDRLLDRSSAGEDPTNVDEGADNQYLDAFKVAKFTYVDGRDVGDGVKEGMELEEEEQEEAGGGEAPGGEPDAAQRERYWESLLRDRHEELRVRKLEALGKGKRQRK
eukprot:jgi/Mesen1/4867/ME000244S04038